MIENVRDDVVPVRRDGAMHQLQECAKRLAAWCGALFETRTRLCCWSCCTTLMRCGNSMSASVNMTFSVFDRIYSGSRRGDSAGLQFAQNPVAEFDDRGLAGVLFRIDEVIRLRAFDGKREGDMQLAQADLGFDHELGHQRYAHAGHGCLDYHRQLLEARSCQRIGAIHADVAEPVLPSLRS